MAFPTVNHYSSPSQYYAKKTGSTGTRVNLGFSSTPRMSREDQLRQIAVNQYQDKYNEARTANEQRYQKMLGIADQTTDQRATDIRNAYTAEGAAGQQKLASLGLGNTTISPTLKNGYLREMNSALDRNADQQQQTRLGIMERRTDAYPQKELLLGLLESYGLSGN